MVQNRSALRLIAVGFLLVTVSWVVLLLMVIGGMPSALLLSLCAYAASVAGLALGMVGAVQYVRWRAGPPLPPRTEDGSVSPDRALDPGKKIAGMRRPSPGRSEDYPEAL